MLLIDRDQQLGQSGLAMAATASFLEHQKTSPLHQPQTSSRILYDIPCKVCTDHSSGKHYGIFACDGCAGFFKRSIRRNRQYVCKAKTEGGCLVDKTHRNQCRACRLKRCVEVGMNREAVQHERGPRNSTLRRQMSMYFKEHHHQHHHGMSPPLSTPPQLPLLAGNNQHSPPLLPPTTALDFSSSSSTSPKPTPPPTTSLPFFVDPRLLAASAAAAAAHGSVSSGSPTTPSYFTSFPRPPLFVPTPKYPHELTPPPPPPAISHPVSAFIPSSPPPPIAATTTPTATSTETLSEAAARILFMNVRWAQNVPAFLNLPYKDQMTLLEETWRELFVLSASQFALPVEMAATATDDVAALAELKAFQDTIQKFQAMGVDGTEFACLRAIVLLKTSLESSNGDASKELRDQAGINSLQDQAQLTLSQYVSKAYPGQPSRFGKLLLLLSSLRSVSSTTIHSVFFKCIGAIPLEKIICDMFKARVV